MKKVFSFLMWCAFLCVLFLAQDSSTAFAFNAGVNGALQGLGQAMQNIGQEMQEKERQKKLLQYQYELEEERRRLAEEARQREAQKEQQAKKEEKQNTTYTGTGFFVNPDGYLITNAHVIDDKTHFAIRDSKGKFYRATVVAQDKKSDFALLHSEGSFPGSVQHSVSKVFRLSLAPA